MKIILKSVFFGSILLAASGANAAFVNYYNAANWSKTGTAGADMVNTTGKSGSGTNEGSHTPAKLEKVVMTTSTSGAGWQGEKFTISAPRSGMVSFKWSYHSDDSRGAAWDRFGVWLNGKYMLLTDAKKNASVDQSGVYSFKVSKGDIFGFKSNSQDSLDGNANIEISEFKAPGLVPLPGAALLMVMPLMGLLGKKRKVVA